MKINVPSLSRKVQDREAATKSQGLAAVDLVEAGRLLGGQLFVHTQFKVTRYPGFCFAAPANGIYYPAPKSTEGTAIRVERERR